ncbi:hypothetical protein F4561_000098 [Lipingzhangella halophila]|uniref:Uncharacterized protein n=1 Tax=Lipingzhangella halophila TaxID=1783352 RepID=A0A7W7W0J9_9ACTN|nr:hypothetical protein [Lipingzhangella halophila]MBB4929278.1 hypothetical protein [Lipingzhangella halophila]
MSPHVSRRLAAGLTSATAVLALSSCAFLPIPGRGGPPPEDRDAGPVQETEEEEAPAGADGDFRVGEIPAESVSFDEEVPEPESDDPVTQVENAVSVQVQEFAHTIDDSITTTCDDFDSTIDTTTTCTSTFKGESIPFDIDVTGGEYIFNYEMIPTEGLVANREKVEEQTRWISENESVYCTMDEWQMVPVDQTVEDITCYAEGEDTEYEVSFSIYGSISVSPII